MDAVSQDYQRRGDEHGEILVAADAIGAFSPTWFAADSGRSEPARFRGGRGNVRLLDTDLGPLVCRNYLRGGLPRYISRDRYLWTGAERTRAFQEFRLLLSLRARGLPVPVPVAARYWRRGLTYRAALLTRLIPQARTLAEVLTGQADDGQRLVLVADAIAALHHIGVWHADLNASNVLIDAAEQVWLIDFDRARSDVTDPARLAGNLDRLLRSLRKLLPAAILERVESFWPALHERYRIGVRR